MKKFAFTFVAAALLITTANAAMVDTSFTTSTPGPEAVAAGAPDGGIVMDFLATTDADILSIGNVLIDATNPVFNVAPPFGSDTAPPDPAFIALNRALEADSWITTPGDTSLLGPGLDATDGTSTFGDLTGDGAQTDFTFARLAFPAGTTGTFSGRVTVAGSGGPENFPFSFAIGGGMDMLTPSIVDGSTIDLTDAYRNNGGAAPAAISFTGTGTINSATVGTQSIAGLFGASVNGLDIDLSVDTGIGAMFPAGTAADGVLSISTTAGDFSYNLTSTVPEPTTLALLSFAAVGMVTFRRSK